MKKKKDFLFRRIEYDLRSPANTTQGNPLNARSPVLRHKQIRQDSISSDLSNLTVDSEGNLENEWATWNKIINNWPVYIKKKTTMDSSNKYPSNKSIKERLNCF